MTKMVVPFSQYLDYQTKNHNSLYYKHYNSIRTMIGASATRYIQYSILKICDNKINFFSIQKNKNILKEISITSSSKLVIRVSMC